MKTFCIIVGCLIVASFLLSACKIQSQPTINYKRKLERYFQGEDMSNKHSSGMIDLSEGPKLRYDANFGPRDLNFDIKIVNPY